MMDEGKVSEARKAVAAGLKTADPAMWHRIIMCVLIGFAGIALVGGVVMDFVLERQPQELRRMPVVGVTENAVLPHGQYFIYQVYFDNSNRIHYLVSATTGGVMVSVAAPEGTEEPEDIMQMIHYDPAAYLLEVDKGGRWTFLSTSIRENILKKIQTSAAP